MSRAARRCPVCARQLTGKRRACDASCAKDYNLVRAREQAAEARQSLDLTTSGYGLLAEKAGKCPLCLKNVRPGKSRIIGLCTPTFPILPELDHDGQPVTRQRKRTWCHEDCVDRLEAEREKGRQP